MKSKSWIAAAVFMLLAVPVLAQYTATLTGNVTTEGAPLPGVTVTVSSPNLQGVRVAYSDANGAYSIPALPAGKYTVTFELTGLQTVTKQVDLFVGTSNKVNAELMVSAVSEAITVTASAPAVLESTQVVTNFTSQQIDQLPVGRTVLATALLAPGVNANTASGSQLQISGGPGYDNLVMVNGVTITESVRNQALDLFVEDAIQETTVLTGGVSAEYGRFTGGVVNSITKSGGNEFSGSFRDSLTNASWTDKTPFPGEADPQDKTNEVYEATLGGFIMRDRLWFFTSGRSADTSDTLETFRSNIPYSTTDEETRLELKLTGQINPSHNVVGSYLDSERDRTNTRFTSRTYDLASLTDRSDPQTLLSLFYNGVITSNFLVEAFYSEREWDVAIGSGGKSTDLIAGTLMLNNADSTARFHAPTFCGVCTPEEFRNNDSLTVKGNYFLSTSKWGSHNMVFGYENFSEQRLAANHQSASDFRVYVNGVTFGANGSIYPTIDNNSARTYIRWTPIFDPANANDLATDSLFVNDRWDLNDKWSFNVGFRYDKNDAVDGNGVTTSDDDGFSPRLTAIYDIQGNGKHRVTAGYNRYQTRVGEGPGTSGETAGNPGAIDFIYGGPVINPGGAQDYTSAEALALLWEWFAANGGTDNLTLLRPNGVRSVPGFDVVFPSTLRSPYVDEFILGYGIQFTNAFVKLDYIYRDWNDFYSFRVDETTPQATDFLGIGHDLQVVENTNDITRTYRAVQIQSAWRPAFHDHRFNVGLNYTYAKLRGNDTQESSTSGTVGNNDPKHFYPWYYNYPNWQPEGYLGGDQRHRLRAWVGYDVPVPQWFGNINLSLLHNFDSGLPYSMVDTIDAFGYTGAPVSPAHMTESQTFFPSYYFSKRGEFRTDDIHSTDLAFNYTRQAWKRVEVFAQAEMDNVFDNDSVDGVDTTIYTYLDGSTRCKQADGSRCARFNPFTETPVEGVHYVKGPDFGKPVRAADYQTPRTYRFSVGFRF